MNIHTNFFIIFELKPMILVLVFFRGVYFSLALGGGAKIWQKNMLVEKKWLKGDEKKGGGIPTYFFPNR